MHVLIELLHLTSGLSMSLQNHRDLAVLPDNEELSEYMPRRSSLGMVANEGSCGLVRPKA